MSSNSPDSPHIVLDSTDPLNLILNNSAMDDPSTDNNNNSSSTNGSSGNPPDWSQLGSLWATEQESAPAAANIKSLSDFMDFNMASSILDMDMDMGLNNVGPIGIEPSALHLDSARLSYPNYDPFAPFPPSASPADILASQFPFTFNPDTLMNNANTTDTPSTKERRLSVTSSSESSGPSFSPGPESIPSPGSYANGYTSDSTQHSSSFPSSDVSHKRSFSTEQSLQSIGVSESRQNNGVDFANDPAAELAHRVRQSAGVMLAVPMNGATFGGDQFALPASNVLQSKLPIPRLQRPSNQSPSSSPSSTHHPKSSSPSATSSAASTPPPSTPPSTSATVVTEDNATIPASASSSITALAQTARPKTSHTTIERRYRTNLNARIQSLRMAVPALRVLEDRDSGSSKKIKKNLKGGVLIKSASPNAPNGMGTVIAVHGEPTPSNPFGEVDVIDERGYVDGVKVARKCSKANVLGKAVEYIRVLKRREMRLRAEQAGLKTLICGLVGGPALLREWEREWKERFGGEEKDEIDNEGDVEDEGDDEEDEDEDEEEGETGKKRKRAKADKDTAFASKKEPKVATIPAPVANSEGQPEKRKRGRPRKIPLPAANPSPVPAAAAAPRTSIGQSQASATQQPQQQYLLAAFALFSFFNSPLTSSYNAHGSSQAHVHKGHVLTPPRVPLAYAPEIISQLAPPVDSSHLESTVTWRDWVQVVHLLITVLLFVSVIGRMAGGFGLGKIRRLLKVSSGMSKDEPEVNKKVEKVIRGEEVTSLTISAVSLYRSLPQSTSSIIKALFLYSLASSPSTSSLVKGILKMRARAIWANAPTKRLNKAEQLVLRVPLQEAFDILSNLPPPDDKTTLVDRLTTHIIKARLGQALKKMFVQEVSGVDEIEQETGDDIEAVIEVAKELDGEVGRLAKNVECIQASSNTAGLFLPIYSDGESDSEEECDSASSMTSSFMSDNGSLVDNDEGETNTSMPFTLLRALVLYRSLFSASSSSVLISVEPPTPTTPIPKKLPGGVTRNEKRMYALRKLLGSRVFETDEVEDARDKVVDLLVEAERRTKATMSRLI